MNVGEGVTVTGFAVRVDVGPNTGPHEFLRSLNPCTHLLRTPTHICEVLAWGQRTTTIMTAISVSSTADIVKQATARILLVATFQHHPLPCPGRSWHLLPYRYVLH